MDWSLALVVALGGAVGSVSRYALTMLIQSRQTSPFPTATLLINVTGSVLLGFLARYLAESLASAEVRLLLMTGFCGGYTTFSTFEYETFQLVNLGSRLLALANVLGSVLAGFAGVLLAVALVNGLFPRP